MAPTKPTQTYTRQIWGGFKQYKTWGANPQLQGGQVHWIHEMKTGSVGQLSTYKKKSSIKYPKI